MKSNKFIGHRPGFVDLGDKPLPGIDFDTLDELLDFEYVKRWRMDPFEEDKPAPDGYFHRYSLSEHRLMAEFKGGKEWYVIGYIKHPEKLDLPKWISPFGDGEDE